jgi:hypothetical protein
MSSKVLSASLALFVLPALACSMVRIVLFDPTSTPPPTQLPTSLATAIPHPTHTVLPTGAPLPVSTAVPTNLPLPTHTALPVNTELPTRTQAPTSPPLPTFTPLPTKSLPQAESMALRDTLAFIKQKGYADLKLMEVGIASAPTGKDQSYTDFVIKVKCMSGDCHTGEIYTNILPILPPMTASSSVTKFHIQVFTADLKLVEDVYGNLADVRNYLDGQISFDELLKKLKIDLG